MSIPRQLFFAVFLAVFFAVEVFLAAAFFAVEVFLAGAFLAAVEVFLAVDVFFAGAFFAAVDVFFAVEVPLAGAFFAAVEVFFAAVEVFLAADFLAVVAFAVDVFLAGAFLAVAALAVLVAVAVALLAVAFASLGSFLAPDTTFFRSAPGRNFGTAVFLARLRSPVWGLRTIRDGRTTFSKAPKPVMATFSPFATSRVIVSSTDSRACWAAFLFPS